MITPNLMLWQNIFFDKVTLSDFKRILGRNSLTFPKVRTHSSRCKTFLLVQPKLQFTSIILNLMLQQIISSDCIVSSAIKRNEGRNFLSFLHMVLLLRFFLNSKPKMRSQFYSKKAMNLKSKINLFCV